MVNLTALRNKINTKVFDNLGSTLSLRAYSQSSISNWGDETPSYASAVDVVAVPWLHIANRYNPLPFGDLQEGDVDMAFKYNQSLSVKDVIFGGTLSSSYIVKEIEEFPIANGLLVKVARLSKSI